MNDKLDFRATLDGYRAKRGEFRLVDMPDQRYLMVDGKGDPNTAPAYTRALGALYPVAYSLKFASKALGRDYVVPPLEGLWWASDMTAFTSARDKARWSWTMMLLVPDWLGTEAFDAALEKVRSKSSPPGLSDVRLETLSEGLCMQTLHIGSFDDEAGVLAHMHDELIPGRGLRMTGKHHEVYLSDPRRTAPARLRTILRQPVAACCGC